MAGTFKKLVPLLDRVLVEKVAAKTKSVGGILLPESAASKARAPPATLARPQLRPQPVTRLRGLARLLTPPLSARR